MMYIMIAYHTNVNKIFSKPMRNRTESQILKTSKNIIMWMKTTGLGTKNHVLDNEISKEYKTAIKSNGDTHKLVPPGYHWHYISGKAI